MASEILFNPGDPTSDTFTSLSQLRPVALEGFCSINGSPDIACSMVALSLEKGTLMSSASVAFGDEAILSLPHVGLQKGVVSRVFDGGFEIKIVRASHVRLATYLDWIADSTAGQGREMRRHDRIVPIRKLVMLGRPGDAPTMVRLVDLSRSGAAFTTSRTLSRGDRVTIGRRLAQIVRLFEGGAAALFDELLAEETFDAMIDLAA